MKREGEGERRQGCGETRGRLGGAGASGHRRGTSEPELLLLHTQRTGRPSAQRPRRPAQRGADTQGTPVLTPSRARPSSTRAWTCEDAEGWDSGGLLRFSHPSSAVYIRVLLNSSLDPESHSLTETFGWSFLLDVGLFTVCGSVWSIRQ